MNRAGVLALALLLPAGCRHEVREGEREETYRPFLDVRVGEATLSEHLTRGTALLIAGSGVQGVRGRPGSWDLDLSPGPDGLNVGLGSAIALTEDGCFLTAAHNLAAPPFTIAVSTPEGVQFAEAKLIASGSPSRPESDFAIVKAAVRAPVVLTWADPSAVAAGTALASMSAPHGRCGGTVLETSLFTTDRLGTVSILVHDLPLLKGDSGGPVVGRDGRLLGMNVLLKGNWTAAREAIAILPDRQWVLTTIAASR